MCISPTSCTIAVHRRLHDAHLCLCSAVVFPELRNASDMLALALKYLQSLLEGGVYPDGVETEQASGYDMGTAVDFFNTLQLLQQAGHAPPPASFVQQVEAMWAYGTYVTDPAACLPRNGDSDLCGNGYNPAVTAYFNRTDWEYVHTNGANGTLPAAYETDGPSSLFPWAGQVVMRSAYDAKATWIWFDVGPYGSSGEQQLCWYGSACLPKSLPAQRCARCC